MALLEERPGFWRASFEALVIGLCAALVGVLANGVRRVPVALGQPVTTPGESCFASPAENERPVPFVTPSLAAARHDARGVVFVDARPQTEFIREHIAGAVNLPPDEPIAAARLAQLREASLVIVYCDRPQCGLSTRLAQRLRTLKLADVRVLSEGWHAWNAAGYPAQSGGL